MSNDFFGGILDSLRGVSGDFMDNALGQATARAIGNGIKPQHSAGKLLQAESLSKLNNVKDSYSPHQEGYAPTSNPDKANEARAQDSWSVESEWLTRLRKFSQIDSEMSAGKVNLGVPR